MSLNPSQQQAVNSPASDPLILVAPPGSGKTHCLISRIQFLVSSGLDPAEILALTFTNKAAREMAERVALRGLPVAGDLLVTTFHSFCLRLCRSERYISPRATIWAGPEQKRAVRSIVEARLKKEDAHADVSASSINPLIAEMSSLLGRPISDFSVGSDERMLLESYKRMKQEQNAIDFDDMLTIVVERLTKVNPTQSPLKRFRAILIDEFQDTSRTQLEFVKLFAKQANRAITVVGDPHQSIYGWRGADFSNWKKLKNLLNPNVVYLSTNYRSTSVVSAVCQGLIGYNPIPKLQQSDNDDQSLPEVKTVKVERDPMSIVQCRDADSEALFVAQLFRRLHEEQKIPYSELCILYRSNPRGKTTRVLEIEMMRLRVPYTIAAGQALYESKVLKFALAYLRFLLNDRDEMAFDFICKERKMSSKTFDAEWKQYRRQRGDSSSAALARLEVDINVSNMGVHREALFKLSALLKSWRKVLSNEPPAELTLAEFVERFVITQGGFGTDEDSTDKLQVLLAQIQPPTTNQGANNNSSLVDQIAAFLEHIALYNPSERDDKSADEHGKCVLSTIHQSKGLEWEAVVVIQCLEGSIPSRQSLQKKSETGVQDVDEERRLMFVAMSRAKRLLYLTHPKPGQDERRSRFCDEVVNSQQPKMSTSAARRRTEFSSARSALKRETPESQESSIVKQINFQCDDDDDENAEEENDEIKRGKSEVGELENKSETDAEAEIKRAKTAPATFSNAFSLMMHSSANKK